MSDRSIVALIRFTGAVGAALATLGSVMIIAAGDAGSWWTEFGPFMPMFSVFFAVFVWLVIPRQPRNRLVWILAASAFFGGVYVVVLATAVISVSADSHLVNQVLAQSGVPADLPRSAAWLRMAAEPASLLAIFLWLTFGLLLFPDGRLPSPRWRGVGALAVFAIVVGAVGLAWDRRPGNTSVSGEGPLAFAGLVLLILAIVLSLVALVVRFRGTSGATRAQFKWIVWGASMFVPAIVLAIIFGGTRYQSLILVPVLLAEAIFLGAYGIAVAKYRLFDIDLVVRRTVVYAIVVGLLAVLYVAAVFALRGLLPGGSDLAVAASTLVVAAVFSPLRRRVQVFVDRRFYRSRYDAQRIVEDFSARLGSEIDLDQLMADWLDAVDEAVKPASATVWLRPRT